MAVRPFAGGKWAHDANMAGWQAGRVANCQSRKAQKTPVLAMQRQWPLCRRVAYQVELITVNPATLQGVTRQG